MDGKVKMSISDSKIQIIENYIKRGWKVFPIQWVKGAGRCSCANETCKSAGKHPLTKNGFKDATLDVQQVKAWLKAWPEMNVGIATGQESGLVVLDVDPRHDGDESFRKLEKER